MNNQSDYIDRFKELEMRNLQVLSNRVQQAINNRINLLNSYNEMFIHSRTNSPKSNDGGMSQHNKSSFSGRTQNPTLYIKPSTWKDKFTNPKTSDQIVNMVIKNARQGGSS